jgi:solute carrier family 8 (sodium/calcium exchanger)
MALGSSAPEILLSIIEIFGNKFEAGDLGPNTIVGSAAYNLFVIIGYCILVVPKGEIRKIKHLRVFFVTATMSIFAYVWLYAIISFISPNVIDLWEAVLTFLFFPLTVGGAYIVDTKIFFGNFLQKKTLTTKLTTRKHDEEAGEAGQPLKLMNGEANETNKGSNEKLEINYANNPDIKHFEEHRKEYINILRELRQKHPDIGIDELQKLGEVEILKRGPKSRAYYRIQATRKLVGSSTNVKRKMAEKDKLLKEKSKSNLENILEEQNPNLTNVYFEPSHYTCFESVGSLEVYVARSGGDLSKTILVDYKTEDGTAERDTDYIYTEGTLTFYPNETRKHFVVNIIDDDVYEEDEHFNCRISNARYKEQDLVDETTLKCIYPDIATVMILDDDHGGVFIFSEPKMEVIENIGQLRVKVVRTSGARGKVKVPYKTIDGTALGGKDFEKKNDVLTFYNNEIE